MLNVKVGCLGKLCGLIGGMFTPWAGHANRFRSGERTTSCSRRNVPNIRRRTNGSTSDSPHDLKEFCGECPLGSLTSYPIAWTKDPRTPAGNPQTRYEMLASLLREGIWDWNLDTDEVEYSSQWNDLIGIDDHELGKTLEGWTDRIHPLDRPGVLSQLEGIRSGRYPKIQNQHRLRHRDGQYRHVEIDAVAVVEDGRPDRVLRVMGTISDVTKQRLVEHKLLFDTYHDPLTGLPNRTRFEAILDQRIESQSMAGSVRFGVIVIDLDRFNRINDGLGHSWGNKVFLPLPNGFDTLFGRKTLWLGLRGTNSPFYWSRFLRPRMSNEWPIDCRPVSHTFSKLMVDRCFSQPVPVSPCRRVID